LLFEYPFFAFRASAVGRRVENNALIAIASPCLPLDELQRVFYNPSYPIEFGGF
jgi:hypothetical protein